MYNRAVEEPEKDLRVLNQALNASNSAIVLTDNQTEDNPIIYCNAAFEKITQYSREEIIGRNCRFLQGKDKDQPERLMLRRALTAAEECVVVVRNYRKDGSMFWNELHLAPVKDAYGRVTHFIGVLNDVSERMLVDKQKDHFFTMVGHELRTPITTIKAAMQIVQRQVDKDGTYGFLSVFVKKSILQINRLMSLITSLLENNRIHTGKMILKLKPCDIREIINNTLEHFEGNDISVKIAVSRPVLIDKVRIEQVLTNLLSNAFKYSQDNKTVLVEVTAENGFAKVLVKDFGIGIAEEKVPYVFDLFYRAHASKTSISGLGMGLFISAEVVRRHNGDIGVESEEGKGSIFWFTVPFA